MNEKKTVLLLILFVNWWLMTKDQEKPLRNCCPHFSRVVLCKACFGLYVIVRAGF